MTPGQEGNGNLESIFDPLYNNDMLRVLIIRIA